LKPAGIEARFLDGAKGKLFVLLRKPAQPSGKAVLIVPPFAEEMNKSRKMFTDVAQGLAARGIAAVLPDLYGTGDSEGEFRDGDWDIWKDDLARAASWAAMQGWSVTSLFCTRMGCALGAQCSGEMLRGVERTVFWQPVIDGERFMTQFLRLRVAASMMEDRKESAGGLRTRSQAGEVLEVAGYELAPRLVEQIDRANLIDSLHSNLGDLHWFEIVRAPDVPLPGATTDALERAKTRVRAVTAVPVVGEPFWSSTEIIRIPKLVTETIDALASGS
jgi:exosortase A-associated hydrolase 2